MRAYLIDKPGGSDALYQKLIDLQVLQPHDVLVEVHAISINPADVKAKQVEEGLSMVGGSERPLTLGWDIAGVVVDVADDSARFHKADRVFGMVNFPGHGKAYAEYVAAPELHLAKIPNDVGFEEAAASTLAALTAYQVLNGNVKKGDRVLIHGGSGGVGHFAVQIAKNLGATVLATSSSRNKDFVLALGADEHIDYRARPFEEAVENVDFVFDTQGGDVLARSVEVLREGGQVISIAAFDIPENITNVADKKSATVSTHLVHSSGADMEALAELLATGVLKPTLARVFEFEELPDAHTEVETGRTVGKVVVKVK